MIKKVIISVIVLAAIFLGFLALRSDNKTENKSEPVIVNLIKKKVSIKNSTTTREILEPTEAFEGEEVETSSSGRALIQMKNGTVTTIDYSTNITIKNHQNDEHTSLALGVGSVWSTVKKVFGQGEYFEIETRNAVAVVRGTSFGISFDGENTILEVTEGSVLFVPIDPKTGERLFEKAVIVSAGQKAIIGKSGSIEIFELSKADKNADWYIFNNGNLDTKNEEVHILDVKIKSGN